MPPSNHPTVDRIAKVIGVTAIVWFTLVAAWGMFGKVGGGHYAASMGMELSAENMSRWNIIAPVWDYVTTQPTYAQFYCHHPFGCFWVYVPLVGLFGHVDWLVYVPAIVMSGGTALLVNRIANNAWGPIGAAAATLGFTMLPIDLAFSNFNALEVLTMFGWAVFLWGQSCMLKTWKRRWILVSTLGALIVAVSEWVGYVGIAMMLAWGMVHFLVPKRLLPNGIKPRRYAQWWIISCVVTVMLFLFWLALFFKFGQLGDLLASATTRNQGSAIASLSQALEARRYRIDISFTPVAILLGKIALPIALLRVLIRRVDAEFYSIAIFVAATVQYVGFRQGADVHVFWPHYYGLYFAFAFAQLVMSLKWLATKLLTWAKRRRAASWAASFAVGFTAIVILAITPDALRGLREGRATWGRYNQDRIRSDGDEVRVVERIAPHLPAGTYLDTHASLWWTWNLSWALSGLHWEVQDSIPTRSTTDASHPFWLGRASWLTEANFQSMTRDFHLEILGDMVFVNRLAEAAPLDAWSFEEREPTPLEWYFVSGVEPMTRLVPDPFATWEWRHHLGQQATPPLEEPQTPEHMRIAHNAAIAANDAQRAGELRGKLDAMLDHQSASEYTQGVVLIGTRLVRGVSPRVEAWFSAEGPTDGEAQFSTRAMMTGAEPLSFIPPDDVVRDCSQPFAMPTRLWKKGFLYKHTIPLYHRVGYETYTGFFSPRDAQEAPKRLNAGAVNTVDLLTVR